MFTLLEYDVSRYISHSLSPRMRRVVSGSFRLPVRPASHGLDCRDLHVTQARSSSGSAQGHHLGRLLTSTSVQSSSSSSSSSSWSLRLRSSLGFLLKRDASSQPKPLPPKTHTGTGRTVALPRSPTETVPKYDPENIEAFRNAHKFQSIPGPTAPYQALPFAGTRLLYYPFSPDKTDNMGSMLTKLQSRYGPIMRIRLGSQWIVFIEHLADIQHAIRTSEKELDSRGPPGLNAPPLPSPLSALDRLRQYVKDPSLALLDAGPKPQKMRNAVAKHLNQERTLANYLRAQDEMAQDLMKQMQRCLESPAELQGLFHRYAIENSGQLCFKQRVGLLGDYYSSDGQKQRLMESYRTIIRCLGEILTGTKLLYTVVNDPFARRFRDARSFAQTWERRQMRDVTMKAVTDKGSVSTLLPEENSLLVALMDDKSLTEMEVSDTMHALMTTRSEASASGLQMLLACMATNTDKQEKLAADIRRVLGPDGALKKDTLEALPYVGACINESLRLYFPMSSGGQIILHNNIVLSNYLVPAGVPIELNSRRTAKNAVWFDHPNFYVPERWMGEKSEKIPSLAFMPFGFIDHGCMGLRSFFFQEQSAALIKILQMYKVDLPEEFQKGQLQTMHAPFRTPREPLPFVFTPRASKSKKKGK